MEEKNIKEIKDKFKTLDNLIYSLIASLFLVIIILLDEYLQISPLEEHIGSAYALIAFNILVISTIFGYYIYPSYKKINIKYNINNKTNNSLNIELVEKIKSFATIKINIHQTEYNNNVEFYLVDEKENIFDKRKVEKGTKGSTLHFDINTSFEKTYYIREIHKNELKSEITLNLETNLENCKKLF